VNFQLKL